MNTQPTPQPGSRTRALTSRAHETETLMAAAYYAPRGRPRLYRVAAELARRYLYPEDLIVGIIGAEGAGKSTLIRGLFPGLELTNDDDGTNLRRSPLFDFTDDTDFFAPHTMHIDVRYESAFRQPAAIAEAVTHAVSHGRRVVIEHFDALYDTLRYNAQILFAIGEEILVARPSVFGPFPARLKAFVERSIRYRRMAHSAEDLTTHVLERDYGVHAPVYHSDVKHGFVISFAEKPDIPIAEIEAKVRDLIARDIRIQPAGEDRIRVGDAAIPCTGTRTHVARAGEIEHFRLLPHYLVHPVFGEHLLVGMVGGREGDPFDDLLPAGDTDPPDTETLP